MFSYGPRGKPSLAAPERLRFNLAHSADVTLLAFTLDCDVGIDVEQLRSVPKMPNIARSFFCKEEVQELLALPATDRVRGFFRCWTRKEAYVKAVGEGMSVPLDSFCVTLSPGDPPRIVHLRHDRVAAKAWTLHTLDFDPAGAYAAALAYNDAPRPVRIMPLVTPAELLEVPSSRATLVPS
jgi:4'-phosphopantetheinyl transferase